MFKYLFKINPLYKCIGVIVSAIALSFSYSIALNLWVFFICMCLILTGSNKILSAIKFLIPTLFLSIGLLMTGVYFGNGAENTITSISSLSTGLNLSTRVFAFAGMGLVFSLTTDPYDFIRSLQTDAKLPRKFAYGTLCAFNLMPYIKDEYKNARMALEVRGVKLSILSIKPIFSTLVNSIRWSETLSIAMQSKGFHEE